MTEATHGPVVLLMLTVDDFWMKFKRKKINKKEMPMTGLAASKKRYSMLLFAKNEIKVTIMKVL